MRYSTGETENHRRQAAALARLLLTALIAAFVSSDAAAQAATTAYKPVTLLQPTGSYPIGRTSWVVVDRSRPEEMTSDPNDHRAVLLHVWYPAAAGSGKPAAYVDIDPTDPAFQEAYDRLDPARLALIQNHAREDAKIAPGQSRFPLVLFSHGLRQLSSFYSTFIENLVSQGYVVVGVEHTYYSNTFRFPDGRLATYQSRGQPKPNETPEERTRRSAFRQSEGIIQAQDLVSVLSELEQMSGEGLQGRLKGRIDFGKVGAFGHSRGGFANPHACHLDRRLKACLNLDGYPLTEAVMQNGIRQPYMHIQEITPWDQDPLTPEQLLEAKQTPQQALQDVVNSSRTWDTTFWKMTSTAYVVTLRGAVHMSFSDVPYIAPDLYKNVSIDAAHALRATNAYILAFFDQYLKGNAQSLLEGPSPFPEVTLEVLEPGKPYSKLYHPR